MLEAGGSGSESDVGSSVFGKQFGSARRRGGLSSPEEGAPRPGLLARRTSIRPMHDDSDSDSEGIAAALRQLKQDENLRSKPKQDENLRPPAPRAAGEERDGAEGIGTGAAGGVGAAAPGEEAATTNPAAELPTESSSTLSSSTGADSMGGGGGGGGGGADGDAVEPRLADSDEFELESGAGGGWGAGL